jgi:hypothetical protein
LVGIRDFDLLFEEVGTYINRKGWEARYFNQFYCFVVIYLILTISEILRYGLLWARQGLSDQDLGLYLNIDRTTASRLMDNWIDDMYSWASEQIDFQPLPDWISHTPESLRADFPNCLFYFVDGTVLEIYTPGDAKCRRNHFNNKHGYCSWSFFLVVDAVGHINYVSELNLGADHDATQWNNSDCVQKLEEKYKPGKKWKYCLGGDKAYPNIDLPDKWQLYVTMTASEPIEVLPSSLFYYSIINLLYCLRLGS